MECINGILSDVSKKLFNYCKAYFPVLLWAGLIFTFSAQSSLPGFDVVFYDFIFKKLAHMFVYAVLFFLLFRAVNAENPGVKNWKVPILLTLMYACLDEFHQVFTPNRRPSPIDIGYDMLGASVVFLRMYRYI